MTRRTLVGTVSLAFLAAAALTACVSYPYGAQPAYYGTAPYYYDYYYYPYSNVYFQIYTGEYYYRSGGAWRHSRSLPRTIYLDRRDREQLHIKSRTPYTRERDRRSMQRTPPPGYQRSPAQNRLERQHNERRHEEYRQKYRR